MGHEQVYRLTGGRLVNYKDGYAALVSYQMQQQTISLLVSSSKSAAAASATQTHNERTMIMEDVPAHLDDSGIPERNIERLSRVNPPTALINLKSQRHLYEQSRR